MIRPRISVIITVFNIEKYIEECLDSVLNQTMREFVLMMPLQTIHWTF